MRKLLLVFIMLFSLCNLKAQELNAVITINSDKVQGSNKQVYQTLKNSLTDYINQTKWTNKNVKEQERINCAFTIIINAQQGNNFEASIQVQATRPVFSSTYTSPILNINDSNFNFRYNEYDPLTYNETAFESNLISTIVFYAHTIIGIDADTFSLFGGEDELVAAEKVMLQAQQSGTSGWENSIGKQNRFALIDGLLSSKFKPLRAVYYNYHRKGLDVFYTDEKAAKKEIETSVMQLDKLHNITIGNYMLRIFLDAKSDEIVSVFSGGKPTRNEQKMVSVLQKVSPTNGEKWSKIK